MEIRRIRPEEYPVLGDITLRAYRELFGGVPLGSYELELLDVARRDRDSEVFVALNDDRSVIGGVTYVPDATRAMSEFTDSHAAGIRMLAVDPNHQRAGTGVTLVEWCLQRAKSGGRQRIILHSTPIMTEAHRIYLRLGFERMPDLDVWIDERPEVQSTIHLMAFTREI